MDQISITILNLFNKAYSGCGNLGEGSEVSFGDDAADFGSL